MQYLDRIFPDGNVDQDLIFIALLLAHLAAALSLTLLYVLRKRRRHRKEEVIKDTIDALLEEHHLEESSTEFNSQHVTQPETKEETRAINSIVERLNGMTSQEFVDYLADYFKTAEYRVITLPDTANKNIPHMIIERNGKKGVIITDQPKTDVTGLPLIRSYHNQNEPKLQPSDSLIIITTGTLSPKAIEFCQNLKRPIIVINGQQLASSIQQMDLATPS